MPGKKPKPEPEKTYNHYAVTPEQFVDAWQRLNSVQEVADELGMPKEVVHGRASQYRNAGVNLKAMPKGNRQRLDVEGLNQKIERMYKELGIEPPPKKRTSEEPAITEDTVSSVIDQVLDRK